MRILIAKLKIDIFFVSMGIFGCFHKNVLWEDYWEDFFISQDFCPIRWISIGCQGNKKDSFSILMFRNLLLRNSKVDSWDTLHTLWHKHVHKLCFLFRSDKKSGSYDNLKFLYNNWKSAYGHFLCLNGDIWN